MTSGLCSMNTNRAQHRGSSLGPGPTLPAPCAPGGEPGVRARPAPSASWLTAMGSEPSRASNARHLKAGAAGTALCNAGRCHRGELAAWVPPGGGRDPGLRAGNCARGAARRCSGAPARCGSGPTQRHRARGRAAGTAEGPHPGAGRSEAPPPRGAPRPAAASSD